ncbi:MAG: glycoside hydrolase family 2 TIM barrel-domain containing protein [Pseudomonadota bacterium]
MRRAARLLFCALSIVGAAHGGATPIQSKPTHTDVSLNGRWQFQIADLQPLDAYRTETDTRHWRRIEVPANWYNEGIEHAGRAWYRRTFRATTGPDDIFVLRFSGVDYAADAWVNEQHVGFHEGYFSAFEFDVSEALADRSRHTLAVLVDSPNEAPGPSWSLHKRLIKGVLGHHDTRPGGAWSQRGQDANTGGIWDAVTLRRASGVYLAAPSITPRIQADANGLAATVDIRGTAPYWRGLSRANLALIVEPLDGKGPRQRIELGTISTRKREYRTRLSVDSPRLWWPHGRGDAVMYRATVVATDEQGRERHRVEAEFGLRDFRRDANGHWAINGKRLFLKGTNYIASQWKSEMTRAKYARDIELMQAANINIVRVHAHVEAKRFYEEADRRGLLVWQDFPLQWGYEETERFRRAARTQLVEMLRGFNNHPSIVVWSLHNEPPWDADWMRWKYDDYDDKQNRRLDQYLFNVARQEEDSRYVHMVSQTAEHPWFGWYSGSIDTFAKPTQQSLITEYGAQALPRASSLKRIFGSRDPFPRTESDWKRWEYHNFQRKETFENAKLAKPTNLDEFIDSTQTYQADLIRFAVASYRRQMYDPVGGIFQFMFVEDWPSVNWGIVDYYRQPKPGYDALRHSYSPLLAMAAPRTRRFKTKQVSIPVWLASDLWQDVESVTIRAQLRTEAGELVSERVFVATAHADSSNQIAELDFSLSTGSYVLRLLTEAPEHVPVQHDLPFRVLTND